MGIIAGHLGMLIALWVVLVAVGLTALVRLAKGLQGKVDVESMAEAVTRPMLVDVLPLVILALLTHVDPTHIVALIWYYVAAVLVIGRHALSLSSSLQKR